MTTVIAPPPPALIGQLSDLIALVLNANAAQAMVKDLQTATEGYFAEKQAAIDAGKAAAEKADQLQAATAKAEAAAAKAEAAAEKAKAEKEGLAQGRADLQASYEQFNAETAQAHKALAAEMAKVADKQAELDATLAQARDADCD